MAEFCRFCNIWKFLLAKFCKIFKSLQNLQTFDLPCPRGTLHRKVVGSQRTAIAAARRAALKSLQVDLGDTVKDDRDFGRSPAKETILSLGLRSFVV